MTFLRFRPVCLSVSALPVEPLSTYLYCCWTQIQTLNIPCCKIAPIEFYMLLNCYLVEACSKYIFFFTLNPVNCERKHQQSLTISATSRLVRQVFKLKEIGISARRVTHAIWLLGYRTYQYIFIHRQRERELQLSKPLLIGDTRSQRNVL